MIRDGSFTHAQTHACSDNMECHISFPAVYYASHHSVLSGSATRVTIKNKGHEVPCSRDSHQNLSVAA